MISNLASYGVSDPNGGTVTKVGSMAFTNPYYTFTVQEWCSDNNANGPCPALSTLTLTITGFSNPSTAVAPT